jgi:hypothetical protein
MADTKKYYWLKLKRDFMWIEGFIETLEAIAIDVFKED